MTAHQAISVDELVIEASYRNSNHLVDERCDDPMPITQINTFIRGVFVNGFHPKLTTWNQNQNQFNNAQEKNLESIHKHINNNVLNCRDEDSDEIYNTTRTNTIKWSCDDDTISEDRSAFECIFSSSRIPQVLATPGGRLCAWNNTFVKMIGHNFLEPLTTMTIFDLVSPSELPKLHEIFVIALYEEFVDNSDGDEDLYISLSVPCIPFSSCTQQMFITISLMYDPDPCKRCFYCIISPESIGEVGKIMHVHQNALTSQLIQ